jgi:dethiobiotin synthetase
VPEPRIVVVSGTGTEVGKTWVTARLLETAQRRGTEMAARKPVQSFSPGEATDAEVLAAASGETPEVICPSHRWLGAPMAPPMAAESLGLEPFSIQDLVNDIEMPRAGTVLIEGAGGPLSPLADDGDTTDLAEATGADGVVIVADAGLGTINACLLSAQAFEDRPITVFLNRYDDASELHRRNRDWLRDVSGLDVHIDIESLFERVTSAPEMEAG